MTLSEIITLIVSVVSALISGGTILALLQIKSTNRKTDAEAHKIDREAAQVETEDRIASFKAQTEAADKLSQTMSMRLEILTKRIGEYEERDADKETRINDLETLMLVSKEDRSKLRIKLGKVANLLDELLSITNLHLLYHKRVIQEGILPDFPEISADLTMKVGDIEARFKKVMLEE